MIITTRNLLQYLLARELVSPGSVVDGDFSVIDVSGRNRNFKVIRHHSTGYFVKQIQNWDTQAIAMLQCEAACYWLARNASEFSSLIALIPEFIYYDPERQILITKLITDSEDLWGHFRRLGKIDSNVSSHLGNVLGTYHKTAGNWVNESAHSAIFPRQIPWLLSRERRNSHPFKQLSPATAELFDRVDASTDLCAVLDELRNDWKTCALMHGDLKLENCILSADGSPSDLALTIVDWELADIGDPCWDVGSILQAFLTVRVMSLPPSETVMSIRGLLSKGLGIEVCESICSFWKHYALSLAVEPELSEQLLVRCLRYGGARMIQSAYEFMQFSPQLSANALCLLQISEDLLKNAKTAAGLLLEFETRAEIHG